MSRVERMFGPRENWGKGDERAIVRERAARQEGSDHEKSRQCEAEGRSDPMKARKDNPSVTCGDSALLGEPKGTARGREEKNRGIRGFVSIKCPECGKVHTTCLHEARTIFNCKDCGQPVALEGLKSIKMECPRCRYKARYLTNRQEQKIQMECLNCSQPVNFRQGFRRGNYVVEVEV